MTTIIWTNIITGALFVVLAFSLPFAERRLRVLILRAALFPLAIYCWSLWMVVQL